MADPRTESTRLIRQPAVLAWLRLARIVQKINRRSVEHVRGWNLSLAQFDVLAQVGAAEGCTQQELADHLLVTKGNVSQLLDTLEHAGLVVREQAGRVKRLRLTPVGRRLYTAVVPAQEAFVAGQFGTLSPDEQRQLLRLLRRLDRHLS